MGMSFSEWLCACLSFKPLENPKFTPTVSELFNEAIRKMESK